MKGFAKWLVRHRVAVIILCLLLLIPSVMGMAATKTKYDLLYYLPQDLETVKGQEILLQDFGKGAFSLLVTFGICVSHERRAADRNFAGRNPQYLPKWRLHADCGIF